MQRFTIGVLSMQSITFFYRLKTMLRNASLIVNLSIIFSLQNQ